MKWLADGTLGYLPAGCTQHLSAFVYFEHFCCRLQDFPLNKHWAGPFRCLSAFLEALCQVLRLLLRWSRPSWLAWLGVHTAQWRFDSTFIPAHYPVDYSVLYSGPVRIITMMPRPRTLQPSPLASYYFSNQIQVPEMGMGMGLGCVLRLPVCNETAQYAGHWSPAPCCCRPRRRRRLLLMMMHLIFAVWMHQLRSAFRLRAEGDQTVPHCHLKHIKLRPEFVLA